MGSCCHNKEKDLEKTVQRHKKVLWIVLAINAVMFFVELSYGLAAHSLALVGDSLDMLGDAVTYASSIMVVGLAVSEKARVAKLKASIMLIFGVLISGKCLYNGLNPSIPDSNTMFSIGSLALVMNLTCLVLLTRHREDDINMKSVWICSRNDIVANVMILLAAWVVLLTSSQIPDLVVGVVLTYLFTSSAISIFKEANLVQKKAKAPMSH